MKSEMKMVNIMVDIETLSTDSNAVILTIGAIPFSSDGIISVDEDMYFYRRVNLQSYNKYKNNEFNFNYETLLWWLKQDQKIRDEAFSNRPRYDIEIVMKDFIDYLATIRKYLNDDKIHIWSHGKDFDVVILQNAFKVCKLECPWKFWDTRDTRTIYALANIDMKNIGGFECHNAIGDCLKQIEGIKQSYTIINNFSNKKIKK